MTIKEVLSKIEGLKDRLAEEHWMEIDELLAYFKEFQFPPNHLIDFVSKLFPNDPNFKMDHEKFNLILKVLRETAEKSISDAKSEGFLAGLEKSQQQASEELWAKEDYEKSLSKLGVNREDLESNELSDETKKAILEKLSQSEQTSSLSREKWALKIWWRFALAAPLFLFFFGALGFLSEVILSETDYQGVKITEYAKWPSTMLLVISVLAFFIYGLSLAIYVSRKNT